MNNSLAKKLAKYVENPNMSSVYVLMLSSLSVLGLPVMWLAGVVVSFYILEKELNSHALVIFAVVFPMMLAFFFLDDMLLWQVFWQVVLFALLIVALSYVLRWYSSWTVLLQFAGIFCALAIILLYSIYPEIDAWWYDRLISFFDPTELVQADVDIANYAKYATGMQAITVLISVVFNIVVARIWQAGIYNKVAKAKKELLAAKSTYTSLLVIFAMLIATVYKVNWGLDALIVALAPSFFVGLSLFHSWLQKSCKKKSRAGIATMFYVMNVILFPYVPVMVVSMGILDTMVDLRKKFGIKHN